MSTKTESRQPTLRPLRKDEIDRRIGTLVEGLALSVESVDGRPHWISAAELVKRMRPFIVLS